MHFESMNNWNHCKWWRKYTWLCCTEDGCRHKATPNQHFDSPGPNSTAQLIEIFYKQQLNTVYRFTTNTLEYPIFLTCNLFTYSYTPIWILQFLPFCIFTVEFFFSFFLSWVLFMDYMLCGWFNAWLRQQLTLRSHSHSHSHLMYDYSEILFPLHTINR